MFHSSAYTGGEPRVLFDTERHSVDIRECGHSPARCRSTTRASNCIATRPPSRDLYDDDAVEKRLLPRDRGAAALATGASRVVIFDATRRSDSGAGAKNRDGQRGPASRVHVDYTEKSGPQRVKDLLGETEAARLAAAGARIVQINVWRPIRGPVRALAAGPGRRLERAARGPDRHRPGVSRPGRRDLPPRPSTRRSAGTTRPG